MGKITIIVTIIILILTECENENTPSNSDVIVQVDGKIKNLENFKGFVQNSERGQKDKVRVISYTIEGYSIIHDLEYNGKNNKSTKDYTRDKSGSGKIEITTCESIGIKENHEKISYMVENCESPSIDNGILAIWK